MSITIPFLKDEISIEEKRNILKKIIQDGFEFEIVCNEKNPTKSAEFKLKVINKTPIYFKQIDFYTIFY